MKRILLTTLAMVLLTLPVFARVPQTINVQGVLMDEAATPLPDNTYLVDFQLWNAETGGAMVWSELFYVDQVDGVFNAILGPGEPFENPEIFGQTLWMNIIVDGDDPTQPRVQLTSVATALRAASLDRNAAVLSLNGLRNNVNLQAGANVTITPQDSTLVIAATAGAGGADNDWVITGEDVAHPVGRVFVGMNAVTAKDAEIPPLRGQENGDRDPLTGKMMVYGSNEGLLSYMVDDNPAIDGKAAIFARRTRDAVNHGTGFSVNEINTAITGYNDWGDNYSFGMAGYTWFDFNNTGGVIGLKTGGDYWGALAFRDSVGGFWGMYTPNSLHVGGLTETRNLRIENGANAGYILTSDAAGNATWSPPGAASDDGDWTISGNNMYHAGIGAVAIGTSYPHPWAESSSRTTMQVSALFSPTLALDATYGGLKRWTMSAGSSGVSINKSTDYASEGITALQLTETSATFNNAAGVKRAVIRNEADMDDGGAIELYGDQSSNYTLLLDGRAGTGGGRILVNDANGTPEVTITASHNNSGVGRVTTPVLEITGGSDLSEQFDIGNNSALTKPGMVVSIDPENPGRLTLSDRRYDRRVAGVISGAGGVNTGMVMGQRGTEADGELPVALVGRVYVWADASSGPIEPGDLLTTSDRPGHAMKVADHDQATGAILGKAMTGLTEGQGLILTLVTLQ